MKVYPEMLWSGVQGPLRPYQIHMQPTQQKQRGVCQLRNIIATNDH